MDGIKQLVGSFYLVATDLIALCFALIISVFLRNNVLPKFFLIFPENPFPLRHFFSLWWLFAVYILFFAYRGLYTRRMLFWEELQNLWYACFLSIIGLLTIVSLGKLSPLISRTVLVLTFLNMLWLSFLFRYHSKRLLTWLNIWQKKALILGAGKMGEMVLEALKNEKTLGYEIIGLLDDDPKKHGKYVQGKRILGKLDEVDRFLSNPKIEDVFLAIDSYENSKIHWLINKLQLKIKNLHFVPYFCGLPFLNSQFRFFFNEQFLTISLKNNLQVHSNQLIKRVFDLGVTTLILIFAFPFIIFLCLLIKLDTKGSVFYIHKRWGKGKNIFNCIKFRTIFIDGSARLKDYLNNNQEAKREWEKFLKLKTFDPRVTRIGSFLRKFSLDELPQLFNVLKGEMSLVGPRPYLPGEKEQMGEYFDLILETPPGITGLWQVSGRNELPFKERLELDTWYVRNWSLWLDMVILLKTFKPVLTGKGAY